MFLFRSLFARRDPAADSPDLLQQDDFVTLSSKRLAVFDTTQSTGMTKEHRQMNTGHVTDTASQLLRSFGKRGKGKGQLCRPGGVAVTSEGDIVIVDTENCRLQVFNSMGQHVMSIAEKGQGRHQLNQPMDVCILRRHHEECFLVSDSVNARLQVFDRSGSCVQTIGSGTDLFEYPHGVCTRGGGGGGEWSIVVTDLCRHDVTVLTSSGERLSRFGRYGDGPRDLDHPYFVAADGGGNVVVSDSGNMAIKIFADDGALLYHFRSDDFRLYDEDFVMLEGLATDVDGNVLVVANSNVYVLANDGRLWEALLPSPVLTSPRGLAYSPLGHVIVVQDSDDREWLVYIFRYAMENFRSLRAVPRPPSLRGRRNDTRMKANDVSARVVAKSACGESARRATESLDRPRNSARVSLEGRHESARSARESIEEQRESTRPARESLEGQREPGRPARESLEGQREPGRPARGSLEGQHESVRPARESLEGQREPGRPARESLEGQCKLARPARESLEGQRESAGALRRAKSARRSTRTTAPPGTKPSPRKASSFRIAPPGQRNPEPAYFLGPKPGGGAGGRQQREGRTNRRPERRFAEYDLDKELEVDLDIVHRLREKRCLNARTNSDLSPAHIFGFS